MQTEHIYDEVITRYLLNESSPEEEKFVREWMETDEKNKLYVEELRYTLKLVSIRKNSDNILLDEEWIRLRHAMGVQQLSAIPSENMEFSQSEWEMEDEEGHQSRKAGVVKLLAACAVAASVILLIGVGSGWFSYKSSRVTGSAGEQAQLPKQPGKFDPLMAVVQHEVNTSGRIRQLMLPDGSEVKLSDSSELTYKEPLTGHSREVYLKGIAEFKVAKDKARPFTVYSEDLSTTAIGTRFTVTAKQKEQYIRVRLNEGKVIIKASKGHDSKPAKEIYLVPGQELTYDKRRKTMSLALFVQVDTVSRHTISQPKESPSIPRYDKRSWFMFNNQPLNEVFEALADIYDHKIVYVKKDVKNMYFIGTYDKSDSLEEVLRQIVLLNNLTLTKQNDTFKIGRK